jgi:hypothetical protein
MQKGGADMRERRWEYNIEARIEIAASSRKEADEMASEAIRQVKEAAHDRGISLDWGETAECVEPP